MQKILMLAVVLGALACGGSETTCDPCPGSVREEPSTMRTQTGDLAVTRCYSSSGLEMAVPVTATDEELCNVYRPAWLRATQR
jgi:hypothetical protein